MKKLALFIIVIGFTVNVHSQEDLNLTNVLIIGLQEKVSDRFTLEIALLDVMHENNINAKSSINVLKQGERQAILASDSLQRKLKRDDINTYMLVAVRGYDKRFNPPSRILDLEEELNAGHLFPIWRENASSVTFTISFYRNGFPVHNELIMIRSTGSRDAVMKRLTKKISKRLRKAWK